MKVLFVHPFFPGHYPHLARTLAGMPGHQVGFLTREPAGEIPGVTKYLYALHRAADRTIHPYLRPVEMAVLNGQAAYRSAIELKTNGFEPDLICFHAGFGPGHYLREAFPQAQFLGYFEWYYHSRDGDADFLEPDGLDIDRRCAIRTRNASVLLDFTAADLRVCPTAFQKSRFPPALQRDLIQLHDGIDTDFFRPEPNCRLTLPDLDLSGVDEIVTYATRGMEPYRGFPQFLQAAGRLLDRRPNLHVVVAGTDSVWYSRRPAGDQSYRDQCLASLGAVDRSRLHFVGQLSYPHYRHLLQSSSVHVYLTVPFVLSWSLLESMACGCQIVASDTAPVREVIEDGRDGLLVDFFDTDGLADRIEAALDDHGRAAKLRASARARIAADYSLAHLMPKHLALMGITRP